MARVSGEGATVGETWWLNDDERAAWLAVMALVLQLPAALDGQLTSAAVRAQDVSSFADETEGTQAQGSSLSCSWNARILA